MQYVKNVLWGIAGIFIALDRALNAVLGGDPDMTISGRFGVAIAQGRCRLCGFVCRALDLVDKGHCARQARRERAEGDDEVVKL